MAGRAGAESKSPAIPGAVHGTHLLPAHLAPSISAARWLQKGPPFYYYDLLSMAFPGKVNRAGIGVYTGLMLGWCILW